jgi:hypothetical protein
MVRRRSRAVPISESVAVLVLRRFAPLTLRRAWDMNATKKARPKPRLLHFT